MTNRFAQLRGRKPLYWAAAAAVTTALAGASAVWAAPRDRAPSERPAAPAAGAAAAPAPKTTQPSFSSIIEDREARKLLSAADTRLQLDQAREALLLYQQVIERYPRSAVRFEAFVRLGKYHLDKAKEPAKALPYFERAGDATDENAELRGEAMLMVGRCFYEMQKYPQAFGQLRSVIAAFPGTEFSNQAYFYIGNAHYKLGAYNRAIEAFSKVGTALSETQQVKGLAEIGKRLFVRLTDQDLVALPEGTISTVEISSSSGDKETVKLNRIGTAISPNYLAEIDTQIGNVTVGDGILQVSGTDTISVSYVDAQTGNDQINVVRKQTLKLVHSAVADFMDGAYRDARKNVVVGLPAYVRVLDCDRDVSASADTVQVKIIAKRTLRKDTQLHKDTEETETASAPTPAPRGRREMAAVPKALEGPTTEPADEKPQVVVVDEETLTLTERPRPSDSPAVASADAKSSALHSGLFAGQIPVLAGEAVKGDGSLQVQIGDVLEMHYTDELNIQGKPVQVVAVCAAAHGSLAELKGVEQNIKDQQLELQTRLKKAEALTNIGRIYKQLGLMEQATQQFREGIHECETLSRRAQLIGGEVLENMYMRLWKLYIELDELDNAAAMCLALQRDFPNSQFVDEALLGLGETAMKKDQPDRAIGIFRRVLELPNSARKADALFQIGLCQEVLAKPKGATDETPPSQQMLESAFLSFQQVFEKYPQSGVAGDAIGRMADFYMQTKDYDRAVAMFQRAIDEFQDVNYIDRVMYDYGRCLYRMWRANKSRQHLDEAITKFRQLLGEYPQSKFAPKAKQLLPVLEKERAAAGGGGGGGAAE